MKNCAAPISKGQKLLLKVLSCLYRQFLECQTHATSAYLANPNGDANAMETELNAYADIINNHAALVKLSLPTFKAYAYIVATDAQGNDFYSTAANAANDTYGYRKQLAKLNTDECLKEAYQVSPVLYVGVTQTDGPVADTTYVTEAMVAARAGCQGVSNIGFILFAIQVDIDAFPFKVCACGDQCGASSTSSH